MDDDEIRRRRVARLAQLAQTSQSQAQPPPQSPAPANPGPATPVATSEPSPAPKPQVVTQPVQQTRQLDTEEESRSTAGASPASVASPPPTKPVDLVADVLHISLQPVADTGRSKESSRRTYLPELAAEHGTDTPLDINQDLDSAMWELLTTAAENRPFTNVQNYFVSCWRRSLALGRQTSRVEGSAQKLIAIRQTIARFAMLSASADRNDDIYGDLGSVMLANSSRMPWDFVREVVTAAADQEQLDVLLRELFLVVRPRGFVDGYRTEFVVTAELLSIDIVAKNVLDLDVFQLQPGWRAAELASLTFLGPYFSVSPIDGRAPQELFKTNTTESHPELIRLATSTHLEVSVILKNLFELTSKLVRAGPAPRRKVLDFFVAVLNANHKQTTMYVDRKQVNANGFMLNLASTLVKFSEPFTDLAGSQISKINPEYFRHVCSYDIQDETKLLADQSSPYNTVDRISAPPNFVTEAFFLCIGFLHYGLQGAIQEESRLRRMYSMSQTQLEDAERAMAASPQTQALMSTMLTRGRERQRVIAAQDAAFFAMLHHEQFMQSVLHFSTFVLSYAVHASSIPEIAEAYANYPEFMVEAPLNSIVHIFQDLPDVASRYADGQRLVETVIYFMQNQGALRNPYLRSRMVEVLEFGAAYQPYGSSRPGVLEQVFTTSKLCQEQLLHALMKIYIDVEHTGRSSEFYDKFTVREEVSHILKILWRYDLYRRNLVEESTRDPDFFVKFVALLLNDSTYLLDEALGKLLEIHKLQTEIQEAEEAGRSINGPAPGQALPGTSRTGQPGQQGQQGPGQQGQNNSEGENDGDGNENEDENSESLASRLDNAERGAKSMLHLGKNCVSLLDTFTKSVPAIFTTPEIVDRFAVMLNYNLAALVGPKCNELKVRDPVKVGFSPKELLCELTRVFLNLAGQEPFIKALARDERSYSPANYEKAQQILIKFRMLSPQENDAYSQMMAAVAEAHDLDNENEEELGEIPDEFLDPLMYTLMENPVLLPSNVTIDLNTIKTHLLSDPTDPFTRQPMTVADLRPNTELKEQIEAFKADKRKNRG